MKQKSVIILEDMETYGVVLDSADCQILNVQTKVKNPVRKGISVLVRILMCLNVMMIVLVSLAECLQKDDKGQYDETSGV